MPDNENPFSPFPDRFIFPGFGGGQGKRRPRGPGPNARQRQQINPLLTALPSVVVPLPIPSPPGSPFPGPEFPAANEPFPAEQIPKALGGILVGVGVGIIVFETARAVLRRKELLDEKRRQRELDVPKRRAPDEPLREVQISTPIPEPVVDPGEIILPPVPTAPDIDLPFPIEIPGVQLPGVEVTPVPDIGPVTLPVPEIPFETVPLPKPAQAPKPIPGFGVPSPFPSPLPSPFPTGLPFPSPVSFPKIAPVAFPVFTPVGDFLTPPQGLGVASQGPQLGFIELPEANPGAQAAQNQCQAVQRKRRRKGKCREGFFKERPGSTDFITWREGDCF